MKRAIPQVALPGCLLFYLFYFFAGAAAAIVYSPVQEYSLPASAVPVNLQVPEPLMPFILPVPPVI